jgi:hypothetical protein
VLQTRQGFRGTGAPARRFIKRDQCRAGAPASNIVKPQKRQ